MHKKLIAIFIIMILAFPFQTRVSASNIMSVNHLVENAKALDGTEVIIQGEVIGEPMQRGSYSWINVKDSTNAIGIWIKNEDRSNIKFYGNYKRTGDSIQITGIFNKACTVHGGEPDIHCEMLLIEKAGKINNIKVSVVKITIFIILMIILLVAGIAAYYLIIRKKATFSRSAMHMQHPRMTMK